MNLEVGVDDPHMQGYCDSLERVIEQWGHLNPSQIIAGLEQTKLVYQLWTMGMLENRVETE